MTDDTIPEDQGAETNAPKMTRELRDWAAEEVDGDAEGLRTLILRTSALADTAKFEEVLTALGASQISAGRSVTLANAGRAAALAIAELPDVLEVTGASGYQPKAETPDDDKPQDDEDEGSESRESNGPPQDAPDELSSEALKALDDNADKAADLLKGPGPSRSYLPKLP